VDELRTSEVLASLGLRHSVGLEFIPAASPTVRFAGRAMQDMLVPKTIETAAKLRQTNMSNSLLFCLRFEQLGCKLVPTSRPFVQVPRAPRAKHVAR
jgi:hypothetical protein